MEDEKNADKVDPLHAGISRGDRPWPEEDEPDPAAEFIRRSRRNNEKRRRENTAKFSFTDPFAPAAVVIRDLAQKFETEPGARLAAYGTDVFELMNQASLWIAKELDLPTVFIVPSGGVNLMMDREAYDLKIDKAAKRIQEQSLEWVALGIYFRLVTLSDLKMDPILRDKSMAIAGALAAQYAAIIHNKEDANRHRERKRTSVIGGKNRALSAEEHERRNNAFDLHKKSQITDTRAAEKTIEELELKSAKTGDPLKPNSFLRTRREQQKKGK